MSRRTNAVLSPSPRVKSAVTPAAVAGERQRGGEAEAQARAVEAGAVLAQVRLVTAAGVVERGPALQAERHPPADDPHAADELVGGGPACAPTGM